jgi:DNA-binding response OmpR family regulator
MRPPKTILLVGDDMRVGILRFVIATHSRYRVSLAVGAQQALDLLAVGRYDLLLCQAPLDLLEPLLVRAKMIDDVMPTMVLGAEGHPRPDCYCGAFLAGASTAEVLERMRVMIARKRGPKGCFVAGCRPPRPECFTLSEEVATVR